VGEHLLLPNLSAASVRALLAGYASILDELRRREVIRSSNNPASDYAERLCCEAFGWTRAAKSNRGYDATDANGVRYEVKARRLSPRNASRQLGAIRSLDDGPFDYLVGVLFDEGFGVLQAAVIPIVTVRARSSYVAHTNSWRFLLRDDLWTEGGVRDVSNELRAAEG
jgi:hypothetical protein